MFNVQRSSHLSPRASRLSPLAMAPAAGPGAAPLRPSTLSSHVQRATFNLQPLAPLAPSPRTSRLAPRASRPRPRHSRSGRSAAAPLHVVVPRATCNVQPSTPRAPRTASPRASRLSPHASRHGSRCRSGRSAAAPLHVVVPRATCNVQPSTPRAPRLIPSRLTPLASHNTCTGSISTIHPGGMRSAWISGVGSRARRMRCQR
jgi:hypothetical protein